MPFRHDRAELGKWQRTRDGYILAEGFAARPGVYVYRRPDGTEQRELVPEEELHDPDSLATLGRMPVTLDHPPGDVNPDNVTAYQAGDLDGEIEVVKDTGFVRVKMAVRRGDAIKAVEVGTHRELSPGYDCDLDPTSGTHPKHGPYDAIQRRRRYNHLALVQQARGGPSMRMRADDACAVTVDPLPWDRGGGAAPTHPGGGTMDLAKLIEMLVQAGVRRDEAERIAAKAKQDAEEVAEEMETAAAKLAAAEAARDDAIAKLTDAQKQLTDLKAADAAKAAADAAAKTDAAQQPARIVWHRERARLEAAAERHDVRGETAKIDSAGKVTDRGLDTITNAALRKLVVAKAKPDARADGTDDYYAAAFDLLATETPAEPDVRWDGIKPVDPKPGAERVDARTWHDVARKQFDDHRGRRRSA